MKKIVNSSDALNQYTNQVIDFGNYCSGVIDVRIFMWSMYLFQNLTSIFLPSVCKSTE